MKPRYVSPHSLNLLFSQWLLRGMSCVFLMGVLSSCIKFNNVPSASSGSGTTTSGSAVPSCVDATLTVESRYTGGSNWLDYVTEADTTVACSLVAIANDCLHAGEARKVTVTGETDCDKLTMTDNLGVFTWTCDDTSGTAVFYSYMKSTKHLRDLIDASGLAFRDNYVSLTSTDCSSATPNTSTPGAWWTNTIAALPDNSGGSVIPLDGVNDGGNDGVYTSGTIFVLDESRTTPGYELNMDQVAIVITEGNTLTWEDGGANASNGGASGANVRAMIFSDEKYHWFEGNLNGEPAAGTMADYGVFFAYPNSARVRGGLFQNFDDYAIYLYSRISKSVVTDVTVYNTGSYGIHLVAGGHGYNVQLLDSSVVMNDNSATGFRMNSTRDSVVQNVYSYNSGVSSYRDHNLRMNGVVSVGDDYSNISWGGASYGVLLNSTGALAKWYSGFVSRGGLDHRHHSVHGSLFLSSNSGYYTESNEISFIDVASAHNNNGFSIGGGASGTHHGKLVVGSNNTSNNCTFDGVDAGCAADGSSTHTVVTGVDLSTSIVGYVSSDTSNAQAGQLVFDSITNWTDFQNPFRGWGRATTDNDPLNYNNREDCDTTENCATYDWSLSASDAGNGGAAALLGVRACPSGNDTYTQTTNITGPVTTTMLNRAVEILNDGIGDDDLLCESNESCLYTPNIGAYQGHGDIIASTSCSDIGTGGTIQNVKLYEYSTNGR